MKLPVACLTWFAALALGIAAVPGRAAAASDSLYWHHFAGARTISQDPNAATLKKIDALPETKTLSAQVVRQLEQAPFKALTGDLPSGARSQPELWRPLIHELWTAESVVEAAKTEGHLEWTCALRLNDKRAGLWNTNLARIVRGWKLSAPKTMQMNGAAGWESRNTASSLLIQIVRAGKWVVLGVGHTKLTVLPAWVAQIARTGSPEAALGEHWLKARVNFPALGACLPLATALGVPPTRIDVQAKDGTLRTTAQLQFPEPLSWKPEPWILPTNSIGEPLISFTVAQGFAGWVKKIRGFDKLGLDPVPNQICLWGQANPHVQSSATIAVTDATNLMKKLSLSLPPFMLSHKPTAVGNFLWVSNRSTIIWQAAPFVFPLLMPHRDGDQEYLLGSFFPLPPKVMPPPPELFAQVQGRKNLMYYDWELTSERLPQMNRLWQLVDIAKHRVNQRTNAPSVRWLLAAAPLLGNTITEITKTGKQTATLTRKSKIGFTGFEIATLLRWLDSPGFPLEYTPPPLLISTTNRVKLPKPPPRIRKR